MRHQVYRLHIGRLMATPSNLYCLTFAIYFITYVISYTTIKLYDIPKLINYICLFLLYIKFVTQHIVPRNLLISLLFFGVAFLSYKITKDMNLLMLVAFAITGQGVEVKKLAKIVFWSELFCILGISFLGSIGILQSVYLYREGFGLRTSLGFASVNRFGHNFLALCCAYMLMRWPHHSIRDYLFCVICGIIVEVVSDSRTSVAIIIMLPLIATGITLPRRKSMRRTIIAAMMVIIVLLFFISIYIAFNYDASSTMWFRLNSIMSGRPEQMHYYYMNYHIKYFGYNMYGSINQNLFGMEGLVIDNAYAKLLLVSGIIPTVVFFSMYMIVFIDSLRRGEIDCHLLGLFVYALVGLTEWQMYHFAMNYCMVAFSYCLFLPKQQYSFRLTSRRKYRDYQLGNSYEY